MSDAKTAVIAILRFTGGFLPSAIGTALTGRCL
jgi:hypothetical protein